MTLLKHRDFKIIRFLSTFTSIPFMADNFSTTVSTFTSNSFSFFLLSSIFILFLPILIEKSEVISSRFVSLIFVAISFTV